MASDSDNGLMSNGQQAFIWSIDDLYQWQLLVSSEVIEWSVA